MKATYNIYFLQGPVDCQSLEMKECDLFIFILQDPQLWSWRMISNDSLKNTITKSKQSITLQKVITIWYE